jgi:repressor LexA
MKALTRRQTEVLDFIRGYISGNKYPPTIREISDHFTISVKGAYDHVKALEKKEWIRCDTNRSRAIEVLASSDGIGDDPVVSVPLLGTVAAGRRFWRRRTTKARSPCRVRSLATSAILPYTSTATA